MRNFYVFTALFLGISMPSQASSLGRGCYEVMSKLRATVYEILLPPNQNVSSHRITGADASRIINSYLRQEFFGDFSLPVYKDQVFGGEISNAVFISVFQKTTAISNTNLQIDTARWLQSRPFMGESPRVLLVRQRYPIQEVELLAQATAVIYSEDGGFESRINSDHLYFAGGDSAELGQAMRSAISQTLKYPERKKVTVHILGSLSYDFQIGDTRGFRMGERTEIYDENFFHRGLIEEDFDEFTPIQGSSSYTSFAFKRTNDEKEVVFVLEP